MDPLEFELQRPHGRSPWPWVAGGLAVLLLAVLAGAGLFYRHSASRPAPTSTLPQVATLTVQADPVELRLPTVAGTWVRVSSSAQLAVGSHVRTGAQGRAEVTFADGSVVRLNSASELAITALPQANVRSTEIELFGGEAWCRILPQVGGGTTTLRAGAAELVARGTAFSVRQRSGRLAVYGVQHEVLVRLAGGASAVVHEARALDINPTDTAHLSAAALPTVAQDAGFLGSKWRRENLTRDVELLEAADDPDGLRQARCLLDPAQCPPSAAQVTDLRTSVSDGQALASISLSSWDGRTLQLTWKRDSQVLRQANLTPQPGDLVAQDQVEALLPGAYSLDVSVDGAVARSAQFVVLPGGASSMPSSLPASSLPTGPCPTPSSITVCGLNQIYLDRDGNCEFEACQTCAQGQVGADTNGDDYRDTCQSDPGFSLPPASTVPPTFTCVDPGVCSAGSTTDARGCRACLPPPPSSSAPPPSSVAPPPSVAPLCGNGQLDAGEQCDPPGFDNNCDASCRVML